MIDKEWQSYDTWKFAVSLIPVCLVLETQYSNLSIWACASKGQIDILGRIVSASGQFFRPDFRPQDKIFWPIFVHTIRFDHSLLGGINSSSDNYTTNSNYNFVRSSFKQWCSNVTWLLRYVLEKSHLPAIIDAKNTMTLVRGWYWHLSSNETSVADEPFVEGDNTTASLPVDTAFAR